MVCRKLPRKKGIFWESFWSGLVPASTQLSLMCKKPSLRWGVLSLGGAGRKPLTEWRHICLILELACYTALHCTLHYTMWCSVIYTLQCTTKDYTALHCIQCMYSNIKCRAVYCTTHCTVVYNTALNCTALHCIVLHCSEQCRVASAGWLLYPCPPVRK